MAKANLSSQKFFLSLVEKGILEVRKNGKITNSITGKTYIKTNTNGYIALAQRDDDGKIHHILAHRLVWLVHKGWLKSWHQINHEDGIKNHNWLSNLEKTDNKGNSQHAWKTGLRSGEDNSKALKKYYSENLGATGIHLPKTINKIRKLYSSGIYSQRALAVKFGCSRGSIEKIVNRESYKII